MTTSKPWISIQNTGHRRVQIVFRTEFPGNGFGYDVPIHVGDDAMEFVARYDGNGRGITSEERMQGKAALNAAFDK